LTIRFVTDILHTETTRRRYKHSCTNRIRIDDDVDDEEEEEEEEDDELNNNESSQTQTSFLLLRY